MAYASPQGRALIDRELYLPKEWTDDRERCRRSGIYDEVGFATKTVLARQMITRAVDAGVPFGWVTADEAYGSDSKFRPWLETADLAHVGSGGDEHHGGIDAVDQGPRRPAHR